ncbi:hypothetical protein DM01DRAFT_1336109 [Hesseltinella vesiculosa]|uniref:Sulfotransferase family protein n=1 Tax=Hesseltinella vesiculosa TaxID=101127 RepID=A0A1X2GH20_9FUNG|nr:hypothetical protein DM01DRAFT_1336109 [Hesseltinella vesiculosa]
MPLEVIGAGFGRTGTTSLWAALDKLGYKTHHMRTLFMDDTQDVTVWENAFENPGSPDTDWEKVYSQFTAAVDHPTANFYKELSEVYPDAKVILTVRSAESWIKSVRNTIFKHFETDEFPPGHLGNVMRMTRKTSFGGDLLTVEGKAKIADDAYMTKLFNDHIEEVKRTISADRLLVLNLGDGWEPLCHFLGKAVPDEPYPKTNSTEEFTERARNLIDKGTIDLDK